MEGCRGGGVPEGEPEAEGEEGLPVLLFDEGEGAAHVPVKARVCEGKGRKERTGGEENSVANDVSL